LPADLFAKITDSPRQVGIKGEKYLAIADFINENAIQGVLKMKFSAPRMYRKLYV
jgi:hypothetical protein